MLLQGGHMQLLHLRMSRKEADGVLMATILKEEVVAYFYIVARPTNLKNIITRLQCWWDTNDGLTLLQIFLTGCLLWTLEWG
jgi:hypothetical protein